MRRCGWVLINHRGELWLKGNYLVDDEGITSGVDGIRVSFRMDI